MSSILFAAMGKIWQPDAYSWGDNRSVIQSWKYYFLQDICALEMRKRRTDKQEKISSTYSISSLEGRFPGQCITFMLNDPKTTLEIKALIMKVCGYGL